MEEYLGGEERERELGSVLLKDRYPGRPRTLFHFPPDDDRQEVVFRQKVLRSEQEQPFSPSQPDLYARTGPPPFPNLPSPTNTLLHPSRLSLVHHQQRSPKIEKQAGKLLEKLQNNRKSILSGAGSFGALHSGARFSSAFSFSKRGGEDMSPYENADSLRSDYAPSSAGKRPRRKKGKFGAAVSRVCEKLGLQRLLLILLTVGYTFLGGGIFYALEHQPEQDALALKRVEQLQRRENFTQVLLDVFLRECQAGSFEEQYTLCQKTISQVLLQYDKDAGLWPIKEPLYNWDFWNAMFYSVALYTTMGFGNMFCRTFSGQLATILYAFIGIPLMLTLLNDLGQWCQRICDTGWLFLMGLRARLARRFRKGTPEDEEEPPLNPSVSEGFPLWLAILIVFTYVFLCASLFMLWEDWNYFTAFYFFFISLSTIGLGDVLPGNPHFTLASVVLFILGLALVSMVVNVMQQRVEAKYLAALEMLEEAYLGGDESLSPEPRSPGGDSYAALGVMQMGRRKRESISSSQGGSFDEPPPAHRPSPRKLTAIAEADSQSPL